MMCQRKSQNNTSLVWIGPTHFVLVTYSSYCFNYEVMLSSQSDLMLATLKVNEMMLLLWLQSAVIKQHRHYRNLMARWLSIQGASGSEEVM